MRSNCGTTLECLMQLMAHCYLEAIFVKRPLYVSREYLCVLPKLIFFKFLVQTSMVVVVPDKSFEEFLIKLCILDVLINVAFDPLNTLSGIGKNVLSSFYFTFDPGACKVWNKIEFPLT